MGVEVVAALVSPVEDVAAEVSGGELVPGVSGGRVLAADPPESSPDAQPANAVRRHAVAIAVARAARGLALMVHLR